MENLFITISAEIDAISTTINNQADKIAGLLAKQVVASTMSTEEVEKLLHGASPEVKTMILMKTLSILSKTISASQKPDKPKSKSWFGGSDF